MMRPSALEMPGPNSASRYLEWYLTMQRGLIVLLAAASGAAVGNLYFPQSVSPSVASGLGVSPASATLVVTAVQFGYAGGIFLLVPLGDRIAHRTLIVS